LILAGSGKSQTRALQRIGRVIRAYEDKQTGFVKKDAYVVDFHDNIKYMLNHSRARRRIYETEPEFVIKDFKTE
jgi:superfamily II DNA or RNA helicase